MFSLPRNIKLAIIGLVVTLFLLGCVGDIVESGGQFTINGTIIDSNSQSPINNALISYQLSTYNNDSTLLVISSL